MSIYQINLDDNAIVEQINKILDSVFRRQMNSQYSNIGICAENIAYNWTTTKEVTEKDIEYVAELLFNQWKNSAPHNANMLGSDYTRFGFGAYVRNDGAIFATQEFGW